MTESEWVTQLNYVIKVAASDGGFRVHIWKAVFLVIQDGVLEVFQPQKPLGPSVERRSRDNHLVAAYAPGCWTYAAVNDGRDT